MIYEERRRLARKFGGQADDEQVANASPDFPDLTPAGEESAQRVRNAWAALLTHPEDYA